VNEDTEEEDVRRDLSRERDDDDSRDPAAGSQEPESEEEVSEENVPRIANSPRTPPAAAIPGPITYRPSQAVTPSIRGSSATPSPPPPIQYRSTLKPTKAPRKQIDDVAFKQPIKPPPKPLKPSQAYEIRGKKPVAQVGRSSSPEIESIIFVTLTEFVLIRMQNRRRERANASLCAPAWNKAKNGATKVKFGLELFKIKEFSLSIFFSAYRAVMMH